MQRLQSYIPSLEAVRYQGKTLLFHDLVLAVGQFRDQGRYDQEGLKLIGFESIVKRYTNLETHFLLNGSDDLNAAMEFPIVDINSPLISSWRGPVVEGARYPLSRVAKKVQSFQGQIDLDKAKVTGVFAHLPAKLHLNTGLFKKGTLSDSEVAAIILHEIGHLFTYFEKLVTFVSMNMVIQSAADSVFATEEVPPRIKLVEEASAILGTKVDDPAGLANASSKEAFQTVLLKVVCDKALRSQADSATYDLRSCEFLADQFATRQGAARDLAVALDKMHRKYHAYSPQSKATMVLTEAIKGMFALGALYYLPVVTVAIFLLSMSPIAIYEDRSYDRPGERLQRIKRDLVQVLKDQSLDKAYRARILKDVEVIGALSDDIKDRRTMFNYLWIALTSKRRHQYKQMRFQQELEKLINNDLFVRAAALKQLA